ncbi:MAG: Hpt domain-containing protein [Chitinophagaceae bacterium]|nr:Hpt domain-containing protein [Chitinophagaceae bacterium]
MTEERQYNLFFLNDYFNNEMEAILPILQMYLEETPKELANIEKCLLLNDVDAAKAATHKIKTNISMLSIRDQSSFVYVMHSLNAGDSIDSSVKKEFALFSTTVMKALHQIRIDFFEREDNAPDAGSNTPG